MERDEPSAVDLRKMLRGLEELAFRPGRATSLVKLCEAGALYGMRELGEATKPLLTALASKAKASLRGDLQRRLERVTRSCLELERKSFDLVMRSIDPLTARTDPALREEMFLGQKPCDRLLSLFKNFPVLPNLWSRSISQWREHVVEVLSRIAKDRTALSRAFFSGKALGALSDFRCGLSDPHHRGRTVTLLQFRVGAVIYKPRSGDGEREWHSLLDWINAQSFRPKLRAGRVLRRKGYCWMEYIAVAPCKDNLAARRFYKRMGGTMAAAYLLKAVDCHRDNLIAAGEHPVLVDADALWHVFPLTGTQTPLELLCSTGFFPGLNRRSLQSRSSILGGTNKGAHVARIGNKPLRAIQYEREILRGFRRAWRCLVGTKDRRRNFGRRLRRIRSRQRRCIYWPTEKYATILRASIQPAALRSEIERRQLVARLCKRTTVPAIVVQAGVEALMRLDIPYLIGGRGDPVSPDIGSLPPPVLQALQFLRSN